jgi:hypothetical protein
MFPDCFGPVTEIYGIEPTVIGTAVLGSTAFYLEAGRHAPVLAAFSFTFALPQPCENPPRPTRTESESKVNSRVSLHKAMPREWHGDDPGDILQAWAKNDRRHGFWLWLVTDPILWFVLPAAVFGPVILRSYLPAILLILFVTMALAIWWIARSEPKSSNLNDQSLNRK